MTSKYSSLGFNTGFQRKLIEAWSDGLETTHVRTIGTSLRSAPRAREYARTALRSARKVPAGSVGRRLKFRFLIGQYNWLYQLLSNRRPDQVWIYNGLNGSNFLARAASEELNLPTLYFERAPFQDRIQIDAQGVNYQSSVPQDERFYHTFEAGELGDSRTPKHYVARENLTSEPNSRTPSDSPLEKLSYIFCPLQVPRDTQLTVFGGWIKTISQYLKCLDQASKNLPTDIHLRIKEHPSSPVSFSDQIKGFENRRIVLDNQSDTGKLIAHAMGVITVNSSVGLEAFLFDKFVITVGQAFYSFGDLTRQATDIDSLSDLMSNVRDISWNQDMRVRFMEFLNFWFPPLDKVLHGEYTMADLQERDRVFEELKVRAGL